MHSNLLLRDNYVPEIKLRKRKFNEYLYRIKGIRLNRIFIFRNRKDLLLFLLFEMNPLVKDIQEYYPFININGKKETINLLVTFYNNKKIAFFDDVSVYKRMYVSLLTKGISSYWITKSLRVNELLDKLLYLRKSAFNEFNDEELKIVYLLLLKDREIDYIGSLLKKDKEIINQMIDSLIYCRLLPFNYFQQRKINSYVS